MPKVSAIIPVYNTEKYLEKCLDSVCNQTLSDIEIICIDDCSTDGSLEILKDYAQKDNRIKLIEFKENKGAAAARNEGIKAATGEYIGFIDSDDYPETEHFYEQLYTKARETDADIAKGAYKDSETGYIDETINAKIKENKNNFCSTYCSAIFKNSLIKNNNIKFPLLKDMEDPVFAFACALKANSVEIVDNCNVMIVKRKGSITESVPTFEQVKDKIKGLLIIETLNKDIKSAYVLAYWLITVIKDSIKNTDHTIEEYVFYKCAKIFNNSVIYNDFAYEFKCIDSNLFKFITERDFNYYYDAEKLKKEIDRHDVISFDIFDTLLLRPLVNPVDVFAFIENFYNANGYTLDRTISEKKARLIKSLKNKGCEDITFEDIYKRVRPEYKFLESIEKEFESQILQTNKEMLEIYNYARSKNKKIIITSDMYFDSHFLTKVLNKNGFEGFYKLYVSSEIQLCKGSGNLFKYILNDLNISADKVLHIGDNLESDYKAPQSIGLDTFYYEKILFRFFKSYNNSLVVNYYFEYLKYSRINFSPVLGINMLNWFNNKKQIHYWEKMGFLYGGILGIACTSQIIQIAKARNLTDIFFIARDGFTLKKIFDMMNKNLNVKSHYIYGSRKLKALCSKTSDMYNENSAAEYRKYIDSIELSGNKIGLVDTCAGAFSAQALIEEYLPKNDFIGIYMASFLNYKYNYINLSSKRHEDRDLDFHWDFIEFLFSSFEPPIEDIKDLKPVYRINTTKDDEITCRIYKEIFSGIMDFTELYTKVFYYYLPCCTVKDAFDYIKYFWHNRSSSDNKMLGTINHPIDSNQTKYKPLVKMKN